MRPQVIRITGTGTTAWIPLDYKQNPFNIGLGIVVNGTITYDIEHTFDDVFDASVTPTAFKHSTLVAQTANKDGNYAFPVRAVRVNNTAGTGSTTLTILQGLR
jgi:hypothetical protein